MKLVESIKSAFAHRVHPEMDESFVSYDESEQEDLKYFHSKDWDGITSTDLREYDSAFSFFTSCAFAYYLPALMMISYVENRADFAAIDSITYQLDRSPNINYWGNDFKERWCSFDKSEYDVIEAWLTWLFVEHAEQFLYANTGDRCVATIKLLRAIAAEKRV